MSDNAKWYVIHTYSGYENKVAATIQKTVENRNGIKVPANWQYNSFWFAGAAGIEAAKWNLLPENYGPEEQINLEIEDPALLLQEMLREQEEITKELKELLKEVG